MERVDARRPGGRENYTYDESSFISLEKPMSIHCPLHGWFRQAPYVHLRGMGCQLCGNLKQSKAKSFTYKDWEIAGTKAHEGLYTYPREEWYGFKRKAGIVCRIHGLFFKMPGNHLHNKQGCPLYPCNPYAKDIDGSKSADKLVELQEKSNALHAGKYKVIGPYTTALTSTAFECSVIDHGIFMQRPNDHLDGHGCQKCGHLVSYGQIQISDYIKNLGFDVTNNYKLGDNKEIDVYVPSRSVGVEFNGLRWHCEKFKTDKFYHSNKTIESNKLGIQLIHIFEDEWASNPDKIKTFLSNKLGVTGERYDARKLDIEAVSWQESSLFLNSIHLQNCGIPAQFSYGLYSENTLLCLMCFSTRNVRDTASRQIELTRFCSKGIVRGGFSRLLKHFISVNKDKYDSIISYSENRWSNGGVYLANGFVLDSEVPISYWWHKEGSQLREHRRFFQHKYLHKKLDVYDPCKTEIENCKANNYYRIWDCGKKKWVMKI